MTTYHVPVRNILTGERSLIRVTAHDPTTAVDAALVRAFYDLRWNQSVSHPDFAQEVAAEAAA